MANNPLTMTPPGDEGVNKVKEYESKGAECHRLAETARTHFEKVAWVELRDDWIALAKEAKELALWINTDEAPLVSVSTSGWESAAFNDRKPS
jgi:hypothetical protein